MQHRLLTISLCLFTLFPKLLAQVPTDFPKRESRAVWVTTLGGLDWPKTKASTAAGREKQQQELCALLDQLQAIHINTIFLQTRVRGSVIYPSDIEPWDVALTGQYGKNPGYDPLQYAINECHRRGMELHAWVVTIPCYKIAVAKQMGSKGVTATHAALCKKHNDMYYLDPGQPGSGDYLTRICKEIVSRYDVDGIHFDYIRYPENATSFPDADSYKKYGNGKNKAQWRRDNVTRIVRHIHTQVKALKPWVKVSSSPVGKFRDGTRFSSKGWNCYDAVYQDAQGWLREGIHDALYPMMYFQGDHFFPFAADWHEQDKGRNVTPGLGIYFMAPEEKNWALSVITNQLHYIRSLGLGGQAYFRSKFLTDNVKGIYDYLKRDFYAFPALTPACTWIDNVAPATPTDFHTKLLPDGREQLSWSVAQDNLGGGVRYNVYASDDFHVDVTNPQNLMAAALQEPSFIFNRLRVRLYGMHIAVTAMDRCGNESEPVMLSLGESTKAAPDTRKLSVKDGILTLPETETEFYAITDSQERILLTGPYCTSVNVSRLPRGMYRVRTLQKRGMSHLLGSFSL